MELLPSQAVSEVVGERAAVMTVAPNLHTSVTLVLSPRSQFFCVASSIIGPWMHRWGMQNTARDQVPFCTGEGCQAGVADRFRR